VVIQRLSERRKGVWIPYRDSKLTRYMQTALEGNAKIGTNSRLNIYRSHRLHYIAN
jgi:hypothetical protein